MIGMIGILIGIAIGIFIVYLIPKIIEFRATKNQNKDLIDNLKRLDDYFREVNSTAEENITHYYTVSKDKKDVN